MKKAIGNQLANVEKDIIAYITPPICLYCFCFFGGGFCECSCCFDLTLMLVNLQTCPSVRSRVCT